MASPGPRRPSKRRVEAGGCDRDGADPFPSQVVAFGETRKRMHLRTRLIRDAQGCLPLPIGDGRFDHLAAGERERAEMRGAFRMRLERQDPPRMPGHDGRIEPDIGADIDGDRAGRREASGSGRARARTVRSRCGATCGRHEPPAAAAGVWRSAASPWSCAIRYPLMVRRGASPPCANSPPGHRRTGLEKPAHPPYL